MKPENENTYFEDHSVMAEQREILKNEEAEVGKKPPTQKMAEGIGSFSFNFVCFSRPTQGLERRLSG